MSLPNESIGTNKMTIPEFIRYLKLSKVFTSKQSIVIDYVCIYFEDLKVYKVIVAVDPKLMKKAKKLNINNVLTTTYFDDFPLKNEDKNISTGRYFVMFYPNTGKCVVYTGEDCKSGKPQKELS